MRYRWHEPEGIAVTPGAGGEVIVGSLLARRGYATTAAIDAFLNPTPQTLADPYLLADLARAVERLTLARGREERIAVWGDYDVDGLTSTALLCRAFAGMGFCVHRTSRTASVMAMASTVPGSTAWPPRVSG